MPRFFYTRGSRDLMLRSSCQPRHIRSICLGFKLTEAVLHCRVNKNPKSFHCSSNTCDFLLLRATHTQLPLFHYTPTVRFDFTTAAAPLHRRCTAATPPREVVSGPPLHLLLRATITTLQVRRSFRLHRRYTATSLSTRLFRRRCIFVFSEHEVHRHQIWCLMGCFTRISYWLGLLIAFIY